MTNALTTNQSLISEIEQRLAGLRTERGEAVNGIAEIRETLSTTDPDPTAEQSDRIRSFTLRIGPLDTEIGVLESRVAGLRGESLRDSAARSGTPNQNRVHTPMTITNEPAVYGRGGTARDRSFFADAYRAQFMGDTEAGDYLAQSQREARDAMSQRASSSSSYAGLIIPQYLVDQAQIALRNGRPIANACTKIQIPDQGTTFQIPRATTGASAAVQASENSSVSSTDEVWANVSVNVATVAGQQDVSRQSLERGTPGIDAIIGADLAGAFAAAVDVQVISGSGASGQVLGILNTAGQSAATAYGATITAQNFGSKLAGQIAAITQAGAGIRAKYIFMHPRRWGWYTTLVDTTGRPLVSSTGGGPMNSAGLNIAPGASGGDDDPLHGLTVVGQIQGLPVITDPNIPVNVGTNSEDMVIVADTSQLLLFEDGDGTPQLLRFEQTLGQQLSVKLVSYGYIGFTAARVPAAVGKVGGLDTTASQGQVAPTF